MKSKDLKKTAKETGSDKPAGSEKDVKKLHKQIEQLKQQTDQLNKEKDELFEKLQRVSADYANYQKRIPKQIADSVAYEKKAIIRSLLPSLDNFAHALASARDAKANEGVVKGIEMIFEHILDALKARGLEQIVAIDREFDPTVHEAVMQRAEPDKPDNIVLEEFQAGYKLDGQVIRPSKVIVNKLPAKTPETEPKAPEAAQAQETKDQTTANNATTSEE